MTTGTATIKYQLSTFKVELDKIDGDKLKKRWENMLFTSPEFLNIKQHIRNTIGNGPDELYEAIVSKCKRTTPFITITHDELAERICKTRQHVSRNMKLLLEYTGLNGEKPIILIKTKVYYINPNFAWKLNFTVRAMILEYVEQYSYEDLFETLEAKKKSDKLRNILNKDNMFDTPE